MERYAKQTRFSRIGEDGQARIGSASVAVVGCGALGALAAEQLVRAGVGSVRLIDRDFVELSNLQRQVLFTEADARGHQPKAVAAAERLRGINSDVDITAEVTDLCGENAEPLLDGVSVVVDGTDNLETRYLLNEVCMDLGVPWVYGGCIGSFGQAMFVHPPRTPCLRCLFPEPPPAGTTETCDTAGVIAPAAHTVASLQTAAALRSIVEGPDSVPSRLAVADVWDLSLRTVEATVDGRCETCRGDRPFRSGTRTSRTAVLCGRNAVQLTPAGGASDLDSLASRLAERGGVERNKFLLRWQPAGEEFTFTIFRDGRTVIQGTDDPAAAKSAYARLIGH